MRKYALALSAIVCLLDQVTKRYVLAHRPDWSCCFLDVQIVYNKGLVFGCAPYVASQIYIVFLSILLLWVLLAIFQRRQSIWCWALCLGGGLGNLLDRVCYGYVIDFLRLHIGCVTFPWVFNIADISICFAAMLFMLNYWQQRNSSC